MIIGTDDIVGPGNISEYPADAGSVFKAAAELSFADNPTTKLVQWGESKLAGGRLVPKSEAEEMATAKAVKVENIPDEGMNEDALNILINRQFERKKRQDIISSAEGKLASVAEFGGGLAASFLDPLNLAANVIPVVSIAKYGLWLAKAGGPLARTLIRGGVGAAEGFVGQAALEPFNYILGKQLGDDYTATNSLMNLAFGTIMGGGLHMGVGAVADALAKGKAPGMSTPSDPNIPPVDSGNSSGPGGTPPWAEDPFGFTTPREGFPTQLDNMTHEQRMDLGKTALAQVLDDRPVNIDSVLMEIEGQRSQTDVDFNGKVPSIEEFKVEIQKANSPSSSNFLNPEIMERHNQQIKEIPITMEVQDAQNLASLEMKELTDMAELEGVDISAFKEMVDKLNVDNDTHISILTNMSKCVSRGL